MIMSRILGLHVCILLALFMSLNVPVSLLYDATATPTYTMLCCMVGFIIWFYKLSSFFRRCREISMLDYYERRNSSDDEDAENGDIEAREIHNHHPSRRSADIGIIRVRAHREFRQTI